MVKIVFVFSAQGSMHIDQAKASVRYPFVSVTMWDISIDMIAGIRHAHSHSSSK
jgi:hypothetical protein